MNNVSTLIDSRRGSTSSTDEIAAIDQLSEELGVDPSRTVLFFCSPSYDLARLGRAMKERFEGTVVGCTTAGQLGPSGFQRGGITAVSLGGGDLEVVPFLISPLGACADRVAAVAAAVNAMPPSGRSAFGLILVDGLSLAEERLAALLYESLANVPIVGGSAGDDLKFERTYVYHDGAFLSDAALFVLFRTSAPFTTFKFHQFVPTDLRAVITDADPSTRLVREINGLPAAEGYAALLGLAPSALDAGVYSRHPLMLQIDGDYYVRAIARTNPDASMTFLCAIETGMVLTVGTTDDPLANMQRAFSDVARKVGDPALILGCDCILRRVSFEQTGVDGTMGAFLADSGVIGFSTYGEQWNGIHVNQTFTGAALGRRCG